MPNLFVELVTPGRMVFQGEAESVRAPGVEGSFTVLYNHAPMIASFQVGPLFITTPEGDRIMYATSGGFLEVIENKVTVLAETAEPASEIDLERARESEALARERISATMSGEDRARAERELEQARNRVRVAMGQVTRR